MARISDIRDAIANAVSAETYSRTVDVSSGYAGVVDLKDLAADRAHVFVRAGTDAAPTPQRVEASTRDTTRYAATFTVMVIGKLSSEDTAGVDSLLLVAEEIDATLRKRDNAVVTSGSHSATWLDSVVNPILDENQPIVQGAATFVVEATYLYDVKR